ncbi:MAG: uracil-DNA glycosylase family protein [Candidatus Hydrogenedentes bacterium]|nr:uracil-DNA glycosylase family protein [Candidatus Hydrogenedentota bacterium]
MATRKLSLPLEALLTEVRACRLCEDSLPRGPRPVLRASATARILIVGQAPGTRVHETGIPWNDPSGDRLRTWMNIDRDTFYDESRIAIIPMGYCYPGRHPRGGDLPPRKECAEHWLPKLLAHLPNVELTILAGAYAQRHYLREAAKPTLTETVHAWRDYFPRFVPIPHPSPRNTHWFQTHAWFEKEIVPELRDRVADLLQS